VEGEVDFIWLMALCKKDDIQVFETDPVGNLKKKRQNQKEDYS
jgi:hypothetical protein